MSDTKITRESFTKALERAVQERGENYRYPAEEPGYMNSYACVYSLADGTPACIIGQALYFIDPKLVPDHDANDNAADVIVDLLEEYDEALLDAAAYAQLRQDDGGTWGAALATYKERLGSA